LCRLARFRKIFDAHTRALSIFFRSYRFSNHGGFLMSPAPATAPTREAPPRAADPRSAGVLPAPLRPDGETQSSRPERTLESLLRNATDDEILGLVPTRKINPRPSQTTARATGQATSDDASTFDSDGASDSARLREISEHNNDVSRAPLREADREGNRESNASDSIATPLDAANLTEEVRAALDANPELRRAWQDAQAYRENFATPEDARNATALVADLNRMDALFFSRRPEDHTELARSIAALDPAAFASLAKAIASVAVDSPSSRAPLPASTASATNAAADPRSAGFQPASLRADTETHPRRLEAPTAINPTNAQTEFFHSTNAATVEGVLEAIESQVERLLPEGVSKSARSRVVGEIYRELDTTLRSNRQLSQQMREAFRSGALDADHQHAIVSLVTGRARQALPAVAKRVLNEWTSTIVAANQDRRTRQRTAERRVDIAGSGGAAGDSRRATSPRDINYSRMSDADILNL
jgi:hypothetical protein